MNLTKRAALLLALAALSLGAVAQEYPSLTISGSLKPRTQYNLGDGTGYANLYSGPGGNSYIRFSAKVDEFSSVVMRFSTPYLDDKSGSSYDSTVAAVNSWNTSVGIQDAYAYTDILGELGMNDFVGLKLQAGMFRLKPPTFSRGLNFGLGTGDDGCRSEVYDNYTFSFPGASYESYKWSLEMPVNALKAVFPLTVRVGSDLDLSGAYEKTGFTGYAEVGGRNLYLLDDKFVVDWVLYYTLKARDAAPTGTPYVDNGNIFGGVFSTGFGFENGLSVGLGAAADVALYDYTARWGGSATLRSYSESSINWQAGIDLALKGLFKAYGAFVHRNLFDVNVGTVAEPVTPEDYSQNYVAFRFDVLAFGGFTPYFGGTYVLGYTTVTDPITFLIRGEPGDYDALSWEAGLMWAVSKNIQLDAGYTQGANNAFARYGAVINAIEQAADGAIFFRAGWKF